MKTSPDLYLRRDLLKLAYLTFAVAGTIAVFVVTPALSTPTFLSIVVSILLSPWVSALERRGHSRTWAIIFIFSALGIAIGAFGYWCIYFGVTEWNSFKAEAPSHFYLAINKLTDWETELKNRFPLLNPLHPTQNLLDWGHETGMWVMNNGASIVGSILTSVIIIPPLSFVLLNEGPLIRRRFFQLIPNRYFESFFLVTHSIMTSISDYIRAKMVEGLLVCCMVTIGLVAVKAPYAVVAGAIAGITNIVPYLGPLLGAMPGIFISTFAGDQDGLILQVTLVFIIANLIDTFLVFPLVVAKLVKLHPLILVAVVAVGQHYYGTIGMLLSIPIATASKVVLREIYTAVYEGRRLRSMILETDSPEEISSE